MSPLDIVRDIVTVAQMIYDQVELAENNKKKLRLLADTIRQVVASLQGLKDLPRQKQFIDSLEQLLQCLRAAKTCIEKICAVGRMQRFVYAKTHQGELEGFKRRIVELAQLLNLGLAAQQLINQAQDHEAELKDREDLKRQHEQHLRKVQAAHLNPNDLEAIMRKQLASMECRLQRQFSPLPSPTREEPPLSPHYKVEIDDVIFEKKVGTAHLGDIYQGQWCDQPVIVKWLEGDTTELERKQFIREAQIMSQLNHQSIIPFYGACFESQRMCLVTGFIEGNLNLSLSTLDVTERLAIAKTLVQGLVYLHAKDIVHGDIHPKNIGLNSEKQAKWMNFGLVKTQASRLVSVGVASQEAAWQAPESWQLRSELTKASDMYGFGMLLWTLLTARLPYAALAKKDILSHVQKGLRETIPNNCSSEYAALIQACWSADPEQRPTANDVARRLQAIQAIISAPPRAPSPTGEELYERAVAAEKAGQINEAFDFYQRSANKDYFKSFTSLGLFALQGQAGQAVNKKKAQENFEYAASKGHSRAMFNLARMHEKGDVATGKVDLNTALSWYTQSLQLDPENASCKQKIETLRK